MEANDFFRVRLSAVLRDSPGLFRLGLRYQVRLDFRDGWTLDLGATPRCEPGLSGDADCVLDVSTTDFLAIVADPARTRALFREGRIGVSGRLDAALHFPSLLTLAAADPLPAGLAALLGAVPVERFLAETWPDGLLAVHGPLERLGELAALPPAEGAEAMLRAWERPVRLADKHGGRLVPVERACALFRDGCHLAFANVERAWPRLRAWLARLAWELGVPVNTYGRCLVYASPDGAGEGLHFDENVNFIVQLHGVKRWRVAPNRHVRLPTERFTAAAPHVSPDLALYATQPLPLAMPDDAETIDLAPGSVLVLPRGQWHATTAIGESVSLNFTFDQPTWADILTPALQRSLLRHESWRALARGAGAPLAAERNAAAAHLATLVAELGRDLGTVDVAGALAALTPSAAGDA